MNSLKEIEVRKDTSVTWGIAHILTKIYTKQISK